MQDNIKALCQKYAVLYVNFFGAEESLEDKLFSDYDHLTVLGSEISSKKINDVLLKYLRVPNVDESLAQKAEMK